MSNWQHTLSTILGLAVTIMVPAVVWTTIAAGLYQLARDRIRRIRLAPRGSHSLAHGQQAG
jgi:hypothetical protein